MNIFLLEVEGGKAQSKYHVLPVTHCKLFTNVYSGEEHGFKWVA